MYSRFYIISTWDLGVRRNERSIEKDLVMEDSRAGDGDAINKFLTFMYQYDSHTKAVTHFNF